jgi:hypothetical protein
MTFQKESVDYQKGIAHCPKRSVSCPKESGRYRTPMTMECNGSARIKEKNELIRNMKKVYRPE